MMPGACMCAGVMDGMRARVDAMPCVCVCVYARPCGVCYHVACGGGGVLSVQGGCVCVAGVWCVIVGVGGWMTAARHNLTLRSTNQKRIGKRIGWHVAHA